MYALVNINNSETWDLISDKPAMRKENYAHYGYYWFSMLSHIF